VSERGGKFSSFDDQHVMLDGGGSPTRLAKAARSKALTKSGA
jgi:hypothetical protein